MILMIDNYDSFTFNLVQLFATLGADMKVVRNDRVSLEDIEAMDVQGIVLSPGPGRPEEAGIMMDLIARFHRRLPIFGVCLGHQAIAASLSGRVVRAPRRMHGKTSRIHHTEEGLLKGLSRPFEATRYHSLIVEEATLPVELKVTARSEDGLIMALEHTEYPVSGVQFHPESILTVEGIKILGNFVERVKAHV